jgi:hypothetical protein
MIGFEYPIQPYSRKHGPEGYKDYNSYRDWLRDEFIFRCVYCLHREQWYGRGTTFHIEHFTPVAVDAEGTCEYTNLFYACATCNEAKKEAIGLPNPCELSFNSCLRILPDGQIEALNDEGERLQQILRLNSRSNVEYRARWMQSLDILRISGPDLYEEYMGFPENLPDLRKKRVPSNAKPEGIKNCYFVLRERGELPITY